MKTYKNLYQDIYPFGNLYRAYRAARKGKRQDAQSQGCQGKNTARLR